MPLDSYGEILASLFGDDLARFLDGCDRRHPDIRSGEVASFLDDTDEIIRAYRFCLSEGLKVPSELLVRSSPKFFPGLLSKTRVLKDRRRIEARGRKTSMTIDLDQALREARRAGSDLPKSFDSYASADAALGQMERWRSAAARFESIGCGAMAAGATSLSEDYGREGFGFCRLSIRRAAQILCKRGGVRENYGLRLSVGPAALERLPERHRKFVEDSDRLMEGFPFFDHHVLVSLDSLAPPQSPSAIGLVILGERDGECYFLSSD